MFFDPEKGHIGLEKRVMAQTCAICAKIPSVGNTVSHANNKNKRRWNVNLQTVRALVAGTPRRIRVCANCIRSGRVTKVPHNYSGAKGKGAGAAAN